MLQARRLRVASYDYVPPPPSSYPLLSLGNTNLRVQSLTTGTVTLGVSIVRGGKVDAAVSVPWSWTSTLADAGFSGGSPTKSGTASFASGETEQTISITLAAQSAGADKALTFVLGTPTGGLLVSPSSLTFVLAMPLGAPIARDDTATCVRLSAGAVPTVDIRISNNDEDTTGASLSLGSPSSGTVAALDSNTVRYTAANGTFTGQATFTYTLSRNGATSTATVTVTVSNGYSTTYGVLGQGQFSGRSILTGCWWNGADPESFGRWRDANNVARIDVVTQSMRGLNTWADQAGCASDADVNAAIAESTGAFTARLGGVLANATLRKHLWGSDAGYARARRIHLCWMDTLPKDLGNQQGNNPIAWYNVMKGSGDKALFVLGRTFAKMDADCGIPFSRGLTLDLAYEFSNNGASHPDFPGGYYTDPTDNISKPAYIAFARGWLRLVKAFKQGYAYQAGHACEYVFGWRPQQAYHCRDTAGNYIPYSSMFPNDYASYDIGSGVVVSGVTILPGGALGRQCSVVALSLHDAAYTNGQLTGYYRNDSNSNWALMDQGAGNFWGLKAFLDWTRAKGDLMACFPEWAPWGSKVMDPTSGRADPSFFPAGYIRWFYDVIGQYRDCVGYEVFFQTGLYATITGSPAWDPPQPADQNPGTVYKSIVATL